MSDHIGKRIGQLINRQYNGDVHAAGVAWCGKQSRLEEMLGNVIEGRCLPQPWLIENIVAETNCDAVWLRTGIVPEDVEVPVRIQPSIYPERKRTIDGPDAMPFFYRDGKVPAYHAWNRDEREFGASPFFHEGRRR